MSGDEWETPFDELWGDIPRLLRHWRTLSLGRRPSVSPFSFFFSSGLLLIFLFVVFTQLRSVQRQRKG